MTMKNGYRTSRSVADLLTDPEIQALVARLTSVSDNVELAEQRYTAALAARADAIQAGMDAGLSQTTIADLLGLSVPRVNTLVANMKGITNE